MRLVPQVVAVSLIGLLGCTEKATAPTGGAQLTLSVAGPGSTAALDSGYVRVTGPTNKTVKATPGASVTIDQLAPGTYTVALQGFRNGGVAYYGEQTGVTVAANQNSTAAITFAVFQPSILTMPTYTNDGQFVIVYTKVPKATSYIVQQATAASFANAVNTTVPATDTTAQITIPKTGPFFIRVLAMDPYSVQGQASDPRTITTVTTITVAPLTANIAPGATQAFTATAKDAQGNAVTGVTFFWNSANQAVALIDPATGIATGVTNGVAAITALGLGLPGAAALTVAGGTGQVATQIVFSIQPINSVAGDPLSPAVQVEIQDATGARVTTARDPVTLAIGTNPGGGSLSGTKIVNAINGIASFNGISINKVGTGYTIGATSGSLTPATSSTFNIAPGAAAKLGFTQQPTNTLGNTAISPAVTVTIRDVNDNVVTSATNSVTLAFRFGTNTRNATLSGTQTVAAVAGLATFGNLKIDKPSTGYALTATASPLPETNSSSYNVNLNIGQVSAGGSHNCATTAGGGYCWGYGGNGQLGTGITNSDSVPALVLGGLVFTQVAGGANHSCGITAAGAAYCWGYNGYGQLGNNTQTDATQPVAVTGGHVFATIATGSIHTCGITTAGAGAEDRQVYCWGNNGNGRLGDNTTTQRLIPTRVAEPLQTVRAQGIDVGSSHTCAWVNGGNAYCWGYDGYGQLGDDAPLADKFIPTIVAGGFSWNSLSTGDIHTCGVRSTGAAYCWGYNYYGMLGDNTALINGGQGVNQPTPVAVFGGLTFASVSAGSYHTCGVVTGGGANGYCWGYNSDGQLGDDNSPTNTSSRVPIALGLTFTAISAGSYHTCGVTSAGTYCWGAGYDGRLGNGGTGSKRTPSRVVQ